MSKTVPVTLLLLALLSVSSLLVTQPVIVKVEAEVNNTTSLTARLISGLALTSLSVEDMRPALYDVVTRVDFPIIITDHTGSPRAWKEVGVDPKKFAAGDLERPERLADDPDYAKLLAAKERLARAHEPVAVDVGGAPALYLYYGNPPVLTYLRWMPLALPALSLLSFLGFIWAARSIRTYQMEAFWANFAKGLAHQMGTPVSSLLGWLEMVRRSDTDERVTRGIETDLRRLSSILRRFSKIGSSVSRSPVGVGALVTRTVEEARTRFLRDVTVTTELDDGLTVLGDEELLSWAMEILVKNAYEARSTADPKIEVRAKADGPLCRIEVSDNGHGIPKDKQKTLFKRSFTTKKRGWGVGLLLVHRIVNEMHDGRAYLVASSARGTTFAIELKRSGG